MKLWTKHKTILGVVILRVLDALYTYGIPEKKQKRIISRINKNKKNKSIYVVCLPISDDGILEIYPYKTLLQPYYQRSDKDISIVGISFNKDGAMKIVQEIVQDIYDATEGASLDARSFFFA